LRVEFAAHCTWHQKNEQDKIEIRVAVAAISAPRGLDERS